MPPSQCHTPALMNSKGRASLLKSQGLAAEKQPLEGIRARFLTWNCGLIQGVLEPTVPGCKVVSKCISCLLPRRLLNYHFPLEVFSNHPILPEVSPTKSLITFVYPAEPHRNLSLPCLLKSVYPTRRWASQSAGPGLSPGPWTWWISRDTSGMKDRSVSIRYLTDSIFFPPRPQHSSTEIISKSFILEIRLSAFRPHPPTFVPTVRTATRAHSPKPTRPDSLEVTRAGAASNGHAHQFTFPDPVLRRRGWVGPGGPEEPPREATRASTLPAVPNLFPTGGWGKTSSPRWLGEKPVPQRALPRPQLLPGERVVDTVAPPLLRLRRPPLGLRLLLGAGSRCLSRGA